MTVPMTTLPIFTPSIPDRVTVSAMAMAPSSVTGMALRASLNALIALRTELLRTTLWLSISISFAGSSRAKPQIGDL
jgi:hypothetical protein